MGKGDKRTRRGKIFAGTYGKTRTKPKKQAFVASSEPKAALERTPKKRAPKRIPKAAPVETTEPRIGETVVTEPAAESVVDQTMLIEEESVAPSEEPTAEHTSSEAAAQEETSDEAPVQEAMAEPPAEDSVGQPEGVSKEYAEGKTASE